MFTFHRPKIYRSVNGCCICGAKSSSSRFTDSSRYETEFQPCFNLDESDQRTGEICNACVLLIKRWKKLPKGTDRNWNHVVDARAGPGGKSQLRSRLKHSTPTLTLSPHDQNGSTRSLTNTLKRRSATASPKRTSGYRVLKKYKHRSPKKTAQRLRRMRLYGMALRGCEDSPPSPPSPTISEGSETCSQSQPTRKRTYSADLPKALKAIVDTSYWKREKVCCGTIFKGLHGEVLIHPQLLRPCPSSCLVKGPSLKATARTHRQASLGSDGSCESSEIEETDLVSASSPNPRCCVVVDETSQGSVGVP